MKQIIHQLRSDALAIGAGITVTVTLALAGEWFLLHNAVLTMTLSKVVWYFDLLAALCGGYVAARFAARSPVRHALVAGGLVAVLVTFTTYSPGDPWWQSVVPGFAVAASTFVGAVLREWQRQTQTQRVSHAA